MGGKMQNYYKNSDSRNGGIILWIIVLLIFLAIVAGWINHRLYTPPALTSENFPVYSKFVDFAKKYTDVNEFACIVMISVCGDANTVCLKARIYTDNICEILADWHVPVKVKLDAIDKANDIADKFLATQNDLKYTAKDMAHQLLDIDCVRFYKTHDIVMFYKAYEPFFHKMRPGVVYSLSGRNPSEIQSNILNQYKPFLKIEGNWYASRRLMLDDPRFRLRHVSLPKSLIDCSASLQEIDPNELHKFD